MTITEWREWVFLYLAFGAVFVCGIACDDPQGNRLTASWREWAGFLIAVMFWPIMALGGALGLVGFVWRPKP
jgi:O-antigen ligase